MSKSTQINKRLIAKIPTPGNDVTTLGTNSVGTTNLQDASVTYEKLDPNASFKNVMQGGFQNFVDTQNVLVATSSTGTPAAGFFHSTVINRKSIVDLSQDLKVRMGIERIPTQSIYQLQDEFGPNGESVYAALNDVNNLIRFVGNWSSDNSVQGVCPTSNTVNGYVEITFYGTGLNMLMFRDAGARTQVVSIDGGADSGNVYVAGSAVITARNYNSNSVLNLASGLSLGVHTIRVKNTVGDMRCYGFEVLNESSTLKVNQGAGYSFGKKLTLASQQSPAYNSGFDSGTLGTKGGRVLTYLNVVGNIGRIVNPTNASVANLGSADHTNEEVARVYHWREFAAGRVTAADDFSRVTTAGAIGPNAFTLEDGTTTLYASQAQAELVNGIETLFCSVSTNYIIFTFVGTGLDVIYGSTGARNSSVSIDGGASVGNIAPAGATNLTTQKIVSGLPYGTHVVRFTANGTAGISLRQFIVYQPKKPTLPVGAIELGDYNIMADYTAAVSAAVGILGTGTLRKMSNRENAYIGTWAYSGGPANPDFFESGWNIQSSTAASYFEYTFWGTGIAYNTFVQASNSRNHTVSIDGSSNLSGFTTSFLQNGNTGLTFTPATGVISGTSSASVGKLKLQISGLTLGKHTIRVTYNSLTDSVYADCLDIVTPIHSYKSNVYADLMNTLPIGSCGLFDGRKTTPIKEIVASKKNWSQAVGVTSGPTTTSTVLVPCPDLSVMVETKIGEDLEIFYRLDNTGNVSNDGTETQVYVDGQPVGSANANIKNVVGGTYINIDSIIVPVGPGQHKIELYWKTSANQATAILTRRLLKARAI